ncbi:enoyl-CoA hydratase/isomerase family protein [Silanimonas sp.]|uniref:enoyl-CoA hydratase/isomerase family protein n=1 Tax=Silanimonas sp. TaxID=1929290 RepID=UPI001BC1969C|nr:enoyl-CoA hydratase/isomerase family protein [Silanimonas sp.]MBS3895366.1 enoyl-CoA hydratase/isomerase family protein [Silanimonas sp.]
MLERIAHDRILEIRLARPPVNALNPELLQALTEAFAPAGLTGADGVVLAGGPKVFSGGLDVPHLLGLDRAGLSAAWAGFFAAARAIAHCPVPVAAAIGGHSPAGGCVLALCCDYRIMARGPFRIGLNETQVGLVVPEAIQILLRRVVGAHRAERLMVTGAMLESEQALAIGLVDELADAEHVVARALHWFAALAPLPRQALLTTRQIARADLQAALAGFSEADLEGFIDGWYTASTQDALQALVNRLRK